LKKRTKKLLILAMLAHAGDACAQLRSVELIPPDRNFGYLVGDIIATDAIIIAPPGATLDKQSLPVPGAVAAAIELRSIGTKEIHRSDSNEIRIHAEYQNFLAPERASETEIPPLSIRLTMGSEVAIATIPAWPFQVSPLRLTQHAIDDVSALRPNHAVKPLAFAEYSQRLVAAACLAFAAAVALAHERGWLPGWRSTMLPFATAERRIRKLGRSGETDNAACQELHRAFDATAGRHLFNEDLQNFFHAHPRYTTLQTEISNFFAFSEKRFFAREESAVQAYTDVLQLARSLRRVERRR
jgi:mxaA protein